MNPRVLLTTSVLSGLFGLYVVYALAMNAMIGVQTLETAKPVEVPAPEPPIDSQRMAEQYLTLEESEPWELRSRFRVRSGNTYLYYNEWAHRPFRESDPDNAVEFNPFTMILKNDSNRPFTVQAEMARVRFANAFSFSEPDTGRPVEGFLQGKVTITGPNGLVIEGRNFIYSEDEQQIYSDESVKFRYRNHYGTALGIQLDLSIDPEKITSEEFAVAGVDFIKLRRHVELTLSPENIQNVKELTVTCQGGLVFDTARNLATLREDVYVSMPTESLPQSQVQYDTLKCDTLYLQFAAEDSGVAPADSVAAGSESQDDFQNVQRKLTLTQLEATANSIRQPVIFSSQKNELEATMTHFHYDRISGIATLTTDLNHQVHVTQRQARIFSPRIILEHDEHGEMQTVLCDQAGWMEYSDQQSGELNLIAKWQRQLRVRPEDDNGLYLIELDRQTSVRQPREDLELSADHIKLWVSNATPVATTAASASQDEDESLMGKGKPENLLALGNVRMKHPMVNGYTERLEVWFQDPPSVQQPVLHDISGNRKIAPETREVRESERARTAVFKVVHNPMEDSGHSLFDGFGNSTGEDEPFDVWANLIQVLVYRSENLDDSYAGGIVATGDVTVTQPKKDGSQPLRMQGNRIEVRNRDASNRNLQVHVFGSPARISDAKVSLAGNLLNLDRAENRAWVTGPGVLMQPVNTTLEGKELKQPELLKVWWKEKMDFDGRTAHFFDRVRTELGTSSVLCQEMKVRLNRRVDFQEDPQSVRKESGGERTEIDRLDCLYGVQVDSEVYKDGELTEITQGEFGELVYERSLEKSTIIGPGRIYQWRRDEGSPFASASRNKAIANQPLRTEDNGWMFLQIDFNGDIDGQIDEQITHFTDGVQIVYGPVAQTGQKLSPHELPDRGGWIRSEELEVARHEKTKVEQAWLELRATGNVKLEGLHNERFRALADTVTFDQSKEMYRLRALGDRNTTIWRQKSAGTTPSSAVAKSMLYVPSKNVLKLDETTSLQGIE